MASGILEEKRMVEKAKLIWLDGEFIPWDQAQVHILTHTLIKDCSLSAIAPF